VAGEAELPIGAVGLRPEAGLCPTARWPTWLGEEASMAEHSGERTVAEQRQGGRLPEREWREGGAFVPAQHGDRKTPSCSARGGRRKGLYQ
jgi:hypothetical protein